MDCFSLWAQRPTFGSRYLRTSRLQLQFIRINEAFVNEKIFDELVTKLGKVGANKTSTPIFKIVKDVL